MEDWLIKNKHRLSIRAIEKEIGCPASTLSKVANGNIKLPGKWKKKLEKVAKDMEVKNTDPYYVEVEFAGGHSILNGRYDQSLINKDGNVEISVDPIDQNNPPSKSSPFDIPIEELKKKYNG